MALETLDRYAPDYVAFAQAMGLPGVDTLPTGRKLEELTRALERDARAVRIDHPAAWLAFTAHQRTRQKLVSEPVEDYRIDFEDGFGPRSDTDEDAAALTTARDLARGLADGLLPPFVGIRIKSLLPETQNRALRTLERFLGALLEHTSGKLPPGFVVTLPKVSRAADVSRLVERLEAVERKRGLVAGSLRLELLVELPGALVDAEGRIAIPSLLAAADRRCVALHLGAYDLTASLGVIAAHQSLAHPLCDLARQWMLVCTAGTGVFVADGATTVLPIGPHPDPQRQEAWDENRQVVHAAWRLSHANIRRSLSSGIYQGWDLHPAQLPVRYAATQAFFLESLADSITRLRTFVDSAATAVRSGAVFDDAATGQGLLNTVARSIACGAMTLDDLGETGLTLDEVNGRSFQRIAAARAR